MSENIIIGLADVSLHLQHAPELQKTVEEACREIQRLRELTRSAYIEGVGKGVTLNGEIKGDPKEFWASSVAFELLSQRASSED